MKKGETFTDVAFCSPNTDRHLEDGDDLESDSVARALRVSRCISVGEAETSRETADVNTSVSAILDRTVDSATGWDYDKIAEFALNESHILKRLLYGN